MPPEVSPGLLALLVLAALAAGWVDAVVGGGGLIQLPVLLLTFPAAAPAQVLATNKLASIFGTATASLTYARRIRPDPRTAAAMAVTALLGSAGGAALAHLMSNAVFRPLALAALVVVAVITWRRPAMGEHTELRHDGSGHLLRAAAIGGLIGFYDGIFGPGTGSFLVIALVAVLGYSFLAASGTAKITNFATNLGALLVFVPLGAPMWGVGIAMGLANLTGGYLGARTAIARGSAFVRTVFLVVVSVLIIRLAWDLMT
ncbi:MAG: TSUP family transporter [Kineosporiaceae bacterium]